MSDDELLSQRADPSLPLSLDDAAFLQSYDVTRYALPSVTVDVCALTVLDSDLKALVVQRERPPFAGGWALPGSFLRVAPPSAADDDATAETVDESLEEAAHRTLRDKAGMPDGGVHLRQLITVGPIDRDPRTRVVTVVFVALVKPELAAFWRATTTTAPTRWQSYSTLSDAPTLAFDHDSILEKARARLVRDVDGPSPSVALDLAPASFTIGELRACAEAVKGERLDPGNFRRRFLAWEADGLVRSVPGTRVTGRRRASVFERT